MFFSIIVNFLLPSTGNGYYENCVIWQRQQAQLILPFTQWCKLHSKKFCMNSQLNFGALIKFC